MPLTTEQIDNAFPPNSWGGVRDYEMNQALKSIGESAGSVSGIDDVPGLAAALANKLSITTLVSPGALPDAGAPTDKILTIREVAGVPTVFEQTREQMLGGVAKTLLSQIDSAAVNIVDGPPLTALDNWTSGQTVRAGYAVNASGRVYMYTASGVTGASAPTYTGLNTVADGTAPALYLGPVRAPVPAVDVPVLTVGTARPAGFSKRHNPITNPEKFILSGGVPVVIGSGINLAALTSKNAGTIVTTTPGKNNVNPAVEFITDAPVFYVNDAAFSMSASYRVIVEVDGRRLKDSAVMGSGGGSAIRFDFSAYPVKARRIRLHWTQGVSTYVFEGVWTQAGYNVWAPDRGLTVAGIGTSLWAGSGYGAAVSGQGPLDFLASLCGVRVLHNIAQGSSGLQSSTATVYSWTDRIQDIFDLAPDVLFIEGPHNDIAFSNASQLAANVAFIQQVRTNLPETLVICFGTNAELLSQNAGMLATETNMAAAVAQLADPMVIFVPVMTDPRGAWFFGYRHSGNITAMTIGANAQFTTSVTPTVVVGDQVTPFALTGATGANGLTGTVTAVAGNVVTTDIDTTGAGAFTGPSGYLQVNDVWTSQDGVHNHQRSIPWLAQRYKDALRRKLQTIVY